MKVKDIIRVIEDFAPLSIQEKWDNSGLSIGTAEAPVTSVLLGLDCTEELVDEAVACGADMIVTHHPLDVAVLDPEDGGTGLGASGYLPQEMTAAEAIAYVKEKFSLKTVRTSRPVGGMIRKVALCGGSGASLIGRAMSEGADLYITGDISYHHFFTVRNFMLMDIGHYESEKDIVEILFSLIKKNFPNFAVRISENTNSNPIYYF